MKKFISPVIRFSMVSHCHEVITSSLQIWDESANPEGPVLSSKRDKDWEEWDD